MSCMLCESFTPGDPIPSCMQRGGRCCGFYNGCNCSTCEQRHNEFIVGRRSPVLRARGKESGEKKEGARVTNNNTHTESAGLLG